MPISTTLVSLIKYSMFLLDMEVDADDDGMEYVSKEEANVEAIQSELGPTVP